MKTVELSDIENIFNQFVAAYGSKFSLPTKETVELWVDIFKDCKQELIELIGGIEEAEMFLENLRKVAKINVV